MKKLALGLGFLLLAFVLAGCSQTEEQSIEGQESGVDEEIVSAATEELEFEPPESFQLMIGTFGLEETEWAVTNVQAAELVTLWKAFRSLSTSDNVAQVEREAVLGQIQESMTSDQLAAITEMDLSQENIFELAREIGIVPEGGFQFGGDGGFPDGDFPEGGFPRGGPGGGFPGDGPGGGGGPGAGPGGFGGDFDPDAIATLRAERGGGAGFGNRAGAFLLDPLIELLQMRAGS